MQAEDTRVVTTPPASIKTDESNAASLRARLRETLEFEASFGDEAYAIVDQLFALVAQTLRRDPRFAALRHKELDELLRDALAPSERIVCGYLADMIAVDDALDIAMTSFTGEAG